MAYVLVTGCFRRYKVNETVLLPCCYRVATKTCKTVAVKGLRIGSNPRGALFIGLCSFSNLIELNNLLGFVFAVSVFQKVLLPFCYQFFIFATKLLSIFYCLVECVANDRRCFVVVLWQKVRIDICCG